jgi:hypothetical protein
MRAELGSAAFVKYAGRFVWLSLDVDQPQNQPFLREHRLSGYPAFFIIDPVSKHSLAALMGQADVPAAESFLVRGERAFRAPPKTAAEEAEARGDGFVGAGQTAAGAAAYAEALSLGAARWPERARVVDARLTALQLIGQYQSCAEEALREAPTLPRQRAFAGILLTGMACAVAGGDAAWAVRSRRALQPLAREAQTLPDILDDDRYQLYEQLIMACAQARDAACTRSLADEWLTRIERDDKAAVQGPDAQVARDVARVRAAGHLGQPSRIVAALEATARAQPHSYTVYTRLAATYLAVHRDEDARRAIALGLAASPGTWGARTCWGCAATSSSRGAIWPRPPSRWTKRSLLRKRSGPTTCGDR